MLDKRLRDKLNLLALRYQELDAKVSDPEVIRGDSSYSDYLREHGSLAKQLTPYFKLLKLEQELIENREAEKDPELRELAHEEIKRLITESDTLISSISEALSPGSKDDNKNVILEIRAGTGGDEACLFAADLMRMYNRYADILGWKYETVSASSAEGGGIKEVIISVQGEGVFRALKHEGGGHRVQRVPETESQGRVHTSAATVAVLPEAEEYEVELKQDELQIEICRSGGPGGQSVNTTDSAVKILHIPTGISVHMQDEKSQHKNKAKALRILRSRIYEHYQGLIDAERDEARRSQTGSGDRSERIRTYNFPQNRCTDHRLGKNYSLDGIINGQMNKLIDDLVEWGKQMDFAGS